jgi:hypothetical protein
MRNGSRDATLALGFLVTLIAACGGGSGGGPSGPATPIPTPTPTPEPAGTIRYLRASLPEGSTVEVAPMHMFGQQATDLRFWAGVNMRVTLQSAVVQAFVRTDAHRCMGGGQAHLDLPAGVEVLAAPLSMSHPASPLPPCTPPYTTTHVEFVVYDTVAQRVALETRFPAVYHLVAAP